MSSTATLYPKDGSAVAPSGWETYDDVDAIAIADAAQALNTSPIGPLAGLVSIYGVAVKWNAHSGNLPSFAVGAAGSIDVEFDPTTYTTNPLPAGVIIDGVTAHFRVSQSKPSGGGNPTPVSKTYVTLDGITRYYGTTITGAGNSSPSDVWSTNPATGVAWLEADVLTARFGVEATLVGGNGDSSGSVATHRFPYDPGTVEGNRYYASPSVGAFSLSVDYEDGPTITSVSPSHGAPGDCGIAIIGTGFIDGDEGSICAPGTSVVSLDGTTLTCCLPAAGALTVGGDPFDPGPYNVVVGTATLAFAFTGDVLSTIAIPFINPVKQFFDADGAPLAFGKVITKEAGTNTDQPTYANPDLTGENDNPTILDGEGKCVMWMLPTTYKVTVTDADDVVQDGYPQDNVPGSIWPGAIGAQVTTNPTANSNSLAHQFTATMNKASTGTHALFAANYFAAPTIGAGGATLTESATVYIAGPPTLGSSVYSLHVATGIAKFSGAVQMPGGLTGNMGFYGTTPIAQQVLATGVSATVDQVIAALQSLGLVKQS